MSMHRATRSLMRTIATALRRTFHTSLLIKQCRLRGGDPTVWDSRGRTKAVELDADLANDVSYARGRTTTTYYSQEQTNGATPFSKTKSPVYIASERGEFRHKSGQAIYSGNARAWQDDNYVRGDKLDHLRQRQTNGSDWSRANHDLQLQTTRGDNSVRPCLLRPIQCSTPIRIGRFTTKATSISSKGRIDSPAVLPTSISQKSRTRWKRRSRSETSCSLNRTERELEIGWSTQPPSEVAVLKGNPARVDDVEQGNTEGNRLTLSVRDGKVTADDARGPLSPGRVRSTHKIRKP